MVCGAAGDEELVVVLEGKTTGDLQELTSAVQLIPGVLEVLPAYVNFEETA